MNRIQRPNQLLTLLLLLLRSATAGRAILEQARALFNEIGDRIGRAECDAYLEARRVDANVA